MSATAKTLASLGLALVGLVIYLGIFLGMKFISVSLFGLAIYLGLALTATLFVVILTITMAGDDDAFHA